MTLSKTADENKKRRQKLNNHCGYLRKKGLVLTPDELIPLLPKNYMKGDILTSRDGSWTAESLCWKSREWFYKNMSIDGFLLYKSGELWYSKKHKGSWRSREEAVSSLTKEEWV